ncbi:MAG TPA: alpha-amylase family glycosyl hydrolase, partial [Nevskiaceae bacterium]|nr:alpha-amylase family glycosyl hydrolase [Nevskiaceae bacterium]
MNARHEFPFGAQLLAPGRTRFSLWAPARKRVLLEIDGREPLPMAAEAGGWFRLETGCAAGSCYRYRIADDLAVPDPASRAQAGDVHDCSIVVDPGAYAWQQPDWRGRPWEEMVIYEIHAGVSGGFDGVRALLPHIALLGATAVELMPVADFSGRRNWGYDGVLPYAPDASYGSPNDLKRLVDEAHGHGLCIYLDVVYNHFGPDGNFLQQYAPQFFDGARQSPWGAAIDFSRHQVREFYIHNALYWLNEYRFDGLRFDAVHAIDDRDFLVELARRVRAGTEPGRPVHLMLE